MHYNLFDIIYSNRIDGISCNLIIFYTTLSNFALPILMWLLYYYYDLLIKRKTCSSNDTEILNTVKNYIKKIT